MNKRIVFRVDGNHAIGLGHVTRSLSLAYILRDTFNAVFYLFDSLQAVVGTIISSGFNVVLLENQENDFFDKLNGQEIVVLDGYQFDTSYQKKIKEKGSYLVCIDDLHDKQFIADTIINHAPGVTEEMYYAQSHTRFLLGLDYALLRPSFMLQASRQRTIKESNGILICFGGSDYNDLTSTTLEIVLQSTSLVKVLAVTGSGYRCQSNLVNIISSHQSRVELFHDVSEKEMIDCFLNAHLAIVPASGVLFEAIACKTPVISGYYTKNQFDIYNGFLSLGVMHDAKEFEPDNLKAALNIALSSNNNNLIENQSKCIDGKSQTRYLEIFTEIYC